MKKLFILTFAIAASSVLFSSCKKDHTCTCTDGTDTEKTVFADSKKGDAEDACNVLSTFWALGGGSCSLD